MLLKEICNLSEKNFKKHLLKFLSGSKNMKKTILTLLLFLALAGGTFAADVVPSTVSLNAANTFGVYQVGHAIAVFEEPDENSAVKQKIVWTKDSVIPADLKHVDLFAVYIEKKDLALMSVTDETDDWVEVIYDNSKGSKGWIKKDDPYKFNTWMNFYNMYGRKYGLTILKDAPETAYNMYGSTEDGAKVISTINHPELINLNIIRGNWMLVTVVDADKTPKTGYVRWRSDEGVKYFFPKLR